MLLTSKISLQPKQEVVIERKAPTKMFAKLLHALTSGLSSPQEKHQTFTAISILQELNIALRQANIVNIVRLAKDGNDFYFDAHGKDNDLAEAMKDFKLNTDNFEASLFNDLYLVLEHDDGQLRYLIEIDVKRVHGINEKPINININGVIKALEAQNGETPEQLSERLTGVFGGKDDLEAFSTRNRALFEKFVSDLSLIFTKSIRCESYDIDNKVQLIRAQTPASAYEDDDKREKAPMAHRGYPGWDNYAMYSLCWMGLMGTFGASAADVDIISTDGGLLQEVGDAGLDASSDVIFDMSVDDSSFGAQDRAGVGGYGADSGSGTESSWLGGGDSSSCGGSSCGGGGCGGA